MEKAILMSIKPNWVAKILNGEKTIEVRKKFPKDYVGWVYIYCTKGKPNLWLPYEYDCFELDEASQPYISNEPILDIDAKMNGKVVGRFWCDKVEMIRFEEWILNHNPISHYFTASLNEDDFIKKCGMYNHEEYLDDYLGKKTDNGYAIHISKLEVFDRPKELEEFGYRGCNFEKCYRCEHYNNGNVECGTIWNTIIKAPQSWCYVEDIL